MTDQDYKKGIIYWINRIGINRALIIFILFLAFLFSLMIISNPEAFSKSFPVTRPPKRHIQSHLAWNARNAPNALSQLLSLLAIDAYGSRTAAGRGPPQESR